MRSESLIEDTEYDKLMAELANLEAQYPHFKQANSPTEAVGATLASQDDTIEHKKPMLSLSNTYNQEEVAAFMKRVHNTLENNSVQHFLFFE